LTVGTEYGYISRLYFFGGLFRGYAFGKFIQ